MDTLIEAGSTDKLGRRSGPRRKYTIAEKRAMMEETQRRGASVAEVAHRHRMNANLLAAASRVHAAACGHVACRPMEPTYPFRRSTGSQSDLPEQP